VDGEDSRCTEALYNAVKQAIILNLTDYSYEGKNPVNYNTLYIIILLTTLFSVLLGRGKLRHTEVRFGPRKILEDVFV